MKKKLEAELTSIAHRILKIKNKNDIKELHQEAQKLYEKLSVLLFVEENFGDIKPTIGIAQIEHQLEEAFTASEAPQKVVEVEQTQPEIKSEPEIEVKEVVEDIKNTEPRIEEIVEEQFYTPEAIQEEVVAEPKLDTKQVSIDDLLSQIAPEPIFEKVSELSNDKIPSEINKIIEEKVEETKTFEPAKTEPISNQFLPDFKEISFEKIVDEKPATNLNDKISKSAGLTLNDRVAFEKNLFDGSTEDLNRVISQLATFDTFTDAKNFIEEMVKPDYNDWRGKEEFASRFMEFVESKFV